MVTGIRLKVGKTNVRSPKYMSEATYVNAVNKGMRSIEKDLLYIIQQFEDVTPVFMKDALQPTFDKSLVYVPKKSGMLKDSGYLEIVEYRGSPKVEMGYGAYGRPDYAVYVHEMVEIQHQAPTQAKFLERAVNEDMGDLINRLASSYKAFMGV
jgi:hypothetical protein